MIQVNKRIKQVSIVLLLLLCVFIYKKYLSGISVEDLRTYIEGWGVFAPIAYILAFTILPIAFFPVPILAVVAGVVFGMFKGTIYTLIGAWMNSAVMFIMAKVMAREMILNFLKDKLSPSMWQAFIEADGKKSFFIIFVLRLIPAVPYNVINYGAGLSGMSFKSYIIATMVGIFPGTLVFINIGDKALDMGDPNFMIAIALLVILTVVSLVLAKKVMPAKDDEKKKIE